MRTDYFLVRIQMMLISFLEQQKVDEGRPRRNYQR